MVGEVEDYYFASMPSKKQAGKHFLPACASESSFKGSQLEGSLASSGSKRELTPAEIPPNADMVVPINFGIKYNPSLLGLEYHIKGSTPALPFVYEIPLDVYV